MCIMNCKEKRLIKKSIMILIRIDKANKGKFMECTSCAQCKKLINKFNIKKIYCST